MRTTLDNTADLGAHAYCAKSVSWAAIFAGAAIALVIAALFNLFGLGVGFIQLEINTDSASALGITAVVWLLLSGLISTFIGAWFTGRFSAVNAELQGLVMWSIATIVTVFLAFSVVGSVLSGAGSILKQAVSAVGQAAGSVGQGAIDAAPSMVKAGKELLPDSALAKSVNQVEEGFSFSRSHENIAENSNAQNSNAESSNSENGNNISRKLHSAAPSKKQLKAVVMNFLQAEKGDKQNIAYQEAVNFLVKNTDMDRQKAEQTVQQWGQQYEQLKNEANQKVQQAQQKVKEAAEKASNILGAVALTVVVEFLLSALTAYFGSLLGFKSRFKVKEIR